MIEEFEEGKHPSRRIKPGTRYGKLEVLSYSRVEKQQSVYRVRCDCGVEKEVLGSALKSRTKSCGCSRSETKTIDRVGESWGKLTVISKDPNTKYGATLKWICKCECGKEVSLSKSSIGRTKSCGCSRRESGISRRINKEGYVILGGIYDHPNAYKSSIAEHRYVMSQMIGRPLLDNENVHHKNGVRDDNRPENLELWVKAQPCGQRVEDLLDWAKGIIELYSNYPQSS